MGSVGHQHCLKLMSVFYTHILLLVLQINFSAHFHVASYTMKVNELYVIGRLM